MYSREGLDSKGIISDLQGPVLSAPSTAQHAEYFTTVVNFDYRIHPNWNLYLKALMRGLVFIRQTGILRKGFIVRHGMRRLVWSISRCAIANCFSLPIFYIKDIIWPGVRRLGRHESGYPTRLHRVGLLYSGVLIHTTVLMLHAKAFLLYGQDLLYRKLLHPSIARCTSHSGRT